MELLQRDFGVRLIVRELADDFFGDDQRFVIADFADLDEGNSVHILTSHSYVAYHDFQCFLDVFLGHEPVSVNIVHLEQHDEGK